MCHSERSEESAVSYSANMQIPRYARNDKREDMKSAHAFDEGNFVNFFQRGQPDPYFVERGLTEKTHTLIAGGAPDLGCRLLQQNHLADTVAQVQQFVDRGPSAESGAGAFDAALSFVEVDLGPGLRIETAGLHDFRGIVRCRAAGFANQSH